MNHSPIEPAADMRIMARGLWQVYMALTQEGFSESQALYILGIIMANGNQQ